MRKYQHGLIDSNADNLAGKIHHDARREAWYGNHYNPFRKTMIKRSNTFPRAGTNEDIEAGQGVSDVPLSTISTAPPASSEPFENYDSQEAAKKEETGSIGRPSDPETEATFVGKAPSTRAPSQEEKARSRFISRFSRKNKVEKEEDDGEKKRPWYKGKVLKHKPFTVKNQIQATILNSWINILLLAAPVGIALNYAGVNKIIVFVVNFIAIIPLAAMLSFATEEIALHVGESLGGLLNATFGYVHF